MINPLLCQKTMPGAVSLKENKSSFCPRILWSLGLSFDVSNFVLEISFRSFLWSYSSGSRPFPSTILENSLESSERGWPLHFSSNSL